MAIKTLDLDPDLDPPDPHVFGPPGSGSGLINQRYGSGSFYHQAKIVRKPLIPTVLWHLFDFFVFEKWCKCLQKVISRKTFLTKFASGFGSTSQSHGSADPDPDPHQNVMDPQHWFIYWHDPSPSSWRDSTLWTGSEWEASPSTSTSTSTASKSTAFPSWEKEKTTAW